MGLPTDGTATGIPLSPVLALTDKSYQTAMEDAQSATRVLRRMALVTFTVGNATIVMALIMEFVFQREVWSRLLGGIGFSQFVATFFIAPRKSMKGDGADFSQFILIFTSFMETVVSLRPLLRQSAPLSQRLRAIRALNRAKAEALEEIELYLEPTSQKALLKLLVKKHGGGAPSAGRTKRASAARKSRPARTAPVTPTVK